MKKPLSDSPLPRIITITQFRRYIYRYADALFAGKTFIITKYGKTAAQALPPTSKDIAFAAKLLTKA